MKFVNVLFGSSGTKMARITRASNTNEEHKTNGVTSWDYNLNFITIFKTKNKNYAFYGP